MLPPHRKNRFKNRFKNRPYKNLIYLLIRSAFLVALLAAAYSLQLMVESRPSETIIPTSPLPPNLNEPVEQS